SPRIALPRPQDRDLGRARLSQRADHDALLPPLWRADAPTTSGWAAPRELGRRLVRRAVHGRLLGNEGVRHALRRVALGRAAPVRRPRAFARARHAGHAGAAPAPRGEGPTRAVEDGVSGPGGRGRSRAADAGPGLQLGTARRASCGLVPRARSALRRAEQEG